MNFKTIYIKGMHCKSCVILLTDEISRIEGVEDVRISLKEGTAKVFFSNKEPDFNEIRKRIQGLGYEEYSKESDMHLKENLKNWIISSSIAFLVLIGYLYVKKTGFLNGFKLNASTTTYGVSLVMGVVASLSTCFAVVGSIVISFNEKYQYEGKQSKNILFSNLLFHLGRLSTFFLLGGLLGISGAKISLSGRFVSVYTILISIIMFLLGLNIVGLLPSFGIGMPKSMMKLFGKAKNSTGKLAPFLLGSITFFLPCGFTQSMQIFALTSGSFIKGGLSLFLFALGTMPVLFFAGTIAGFARSKKIAFLQKTVGIIVLIFAISIFVSGISIFDTNLPVISSNNEVVQPKEGSNVNSHSDFQIVEMHVTYNGFEPSTIRIKKNVPVEWIIYGDQITGCTNKIVVPSLNISSQINPGKTVIKFTPTKEGIVNFSCWMGMVRGKFIVE